MKQFVVKNLFIVGIVLIITYPFGVFLDSYLVPSSTEKLSWIMEHSNSSFDDAFLGSSRVEMMLDIKTWKNISGRTALNMGVQGAGLADNYLSLYHFVKGGNTIKRLFLMIDPSVYANKFQTPFRYWYWSKFDDSETKNVIKTELPSIDYYTLVGHPMFKYLKEIRQYGFSGDSINYGATDGVFYQDTILVNTDIAKNLLPLSSLEVGDNFHLHFDKIYDFCIVNDIELVVYTIPIHSSIAIEKVTQKLFTSLDSLAAAHKIRYLNLSDVELNPDSLYYQMALYPDNQKQLLFGHTNSLGSKRITEALFRKVGL